MDVALYIGDFGLEFLSALVLFEFRLSAICLYGFLFFL